MFTFRFSSVFIFYVGSVLVSFVYNITFIILFLTSFRFHIIQSLYLYNILYLRFSLCLEENATRHPSFSRTFYLIVSIFHNYLFLVLKRKIANITRSSINILKIWSRLGADTTTTRRQYYYSSFTTSSVSYCGGCSCTFIYYLSHCIFSHHHFDDHS